MFDFGQWGDQGQGYLSDVGEDSLIIDIGYSILENQSSFKVQSHAEFVELWLK